MLKTSRACNLFESDVFSLQEILAKEGAVLGLGQVFDSIPTPHLRVLAAMLLHENKTRASGYKFGQTIYVRYRGTISANYMSNFMSCRVLHADKTHVKLTGNDGKVILTYFTSGGPKGPSLYNRESFRELREKMLKKVDGDISLSIDPDSDRIATKRLKCEENIDLLMAKDSKSGYIPTIDSVMKDNGVKKSNDEDLVDLVSIVRDIEKGYNVKRKSPSYRKPRSRKRVDESFEVSK